MNTYICFQCQKEFLPQRKPHNLERPFCSQSCAAICNNRLFPKKSVPKKSCLSCSKPISHRNRYCNNKCEHEYLRNAKITNWLKNGVTSVSSHKDHYIKKYLLEDQNHTCAVCNIPDTWNSKEIVFITDHIDGNSENNMRSNLRLVCPNCDSQLPTFKSRNKGNGRHKRRIRYQNGQSF